MESLVSVDSVYMWLEIKEFGWIKGKVVFGFCLDLGGQLVFFGILEVRLLGNLFYCFIVIMKKCDLRVERFFWVDE